jgi:hypothetical protein
MTYNIIKTDNYLLVVDDSEIKEGDYYLFNWYGEKDIQKFTYVQYSDREKNKYLYEQSCKKIIAHLPLNNSPILEGVDLLPPLEDNVEKLAEKQFPYPKDIKDKNDMIIKTNGIKPFNHAKIEKYRRIWSQGYNKAKEKYNKTIPDWIYSRLCVYDKRNPDYLPYDEDDLTRKPTNCNCDNCFYGRTKMADFIIQSLQQPKMPVGFECKMETNSYACDTWASDGGYYTKRYSVIEPKTTTNSQSQTVWVGKYIFN